MKINYSYIILLKSSFQLVQDFISWFNILKKLISIPPSFSSEWNFSIIWFNFLWTTLIFYFIHVLSAFFRQSRFCVTLLSTKDNRKICNVIWRLLLVERGPTFCNRKRSRFLGQLRVANLELGRLTASEQLIILYIWDNSD